MLSWKHLNYLFGNLTHLVRQCQVLLSLFLAKYILFIGFFYFHFTLLIIWELYIWTPSKLTFQSSQVWPPTLWTLHPPKKKSNLCCPYTTWIMITHPMAIPLKKTESFSSALPQNPLLQRNILHPYHNFQKFSSVAFFLGCLYDEIFQKVKNHIISEIHMHTYGHHSFALYFYHHVLVVD